MRTHRLSPDVQTLQLRKELATVMVRYLRARISWRRMKTPACNAYADRCQEGLVALRRAAHEMRIA